MNDVQAIATSGKPDVTYREELDQVESALTEVDDSGQPKRVFAKILARTVVPPSPASATVAPSLRSWKNQMTPRSPDVQNQMNPTVLPLSIWRSFNLTFVIRDPCLSVPSVYRLAMPHMSAKTNRTFFLPKDVGWIQLRMAFDYARAVGLAGRNVANGIDQSDPTQDIPTSSLCVIDARDLLRNPTGTLKAYCAHVGLPFSKAMLEWDSLTNKKKAQDKFQVFEAFHEVALRAVTLEVKDIDMDRHSYDELWQARVTEFGEKGAKTVKRNIDENM